MNTFRRRFFPLRPRSVITPPVKEVAERKMKFGKKSWWHVRDKNERPPNMLF